MNQNRDKFEQDARAVFQSHVRRPPAFAIAPAQPNDPLPACVGCGTPAATCQCEGRTLCDDCLVERWARCDVEAQQAWAAVADHGWWPVDAQTGSPTGGQVSETYVNAADMISEMRAVPKRDRAGNLVVGRDGRPVFEEWDDWARIPPAQRGAKMPDWVKDGLAARGWRPTFEDLQ